MAGATRVVPTVLLCAALSWLAGTAAHAHDGPYASEVEDPAHRVAQVVLGILGYARWPEGGDDIRLCVLGATRYADVLLAAQTHAGQRAVQVNPIPRDASHTLEHCDAVYAGVLTSLQGQALSRHLAGHSVLGISEHDPGCDDGLAFCLDVGAKQVGFQVNLQAVADSGIRVHPSVLGLGRNRANAP